MKLLELANKAKVLPKSSGCYLMKDAKGKILYIGKAKNLNSRVGSYFDQSAKNIKTKFLVEKISDFDFMLTENDAEAFVLENHLIKMHSPKYNIRLRDDKTYPYVVVDTAEPFPTLRYMRRPKRKEGRTIYGPFAVGSNIYQVLRTIVKSFGLRDCDLKEFLSRKYPCLLYQMRQCSAPCVGKIEKEEYSNDLKAALEILKGRGERPLKILKAKMNQLAQEEKFEQAVILRDAIQQIEKFIENSLQKNVEFLNRPEDVDVIAFYQGDVEVDIVFYIIRQGILLGSKNFHFARSDSWENLHDQLAAFVLQYYSSTFELLPHKIIIPLEEDLLPIFTDALYELTRSEKVLNTMNKKIKVMSHEKSYQTVFELTQKLAEEGQRVRIQQQDSSYLALSKLQNLLQLKERPRVLECYDVAIWQGKSPTASQVVFIEGRPAKEFYRYYHLQERVEGNNDFAMLKEFMERRIRHEHLPDLIIVDGGPGQMQSLRGVLQEYQLSIPIVGLAKARSKTRTKEKKEERLFIEGRKNPYPLSQNPALFKILVQMRNEAHRFSRKLHHVSERKRIFNSVLDQIPGIGEKTKLKIYQQLGRSGEDWKYLADLSSAQLQEIFSLTHSTAEKLKKGLKPK